MKHSSQSDAVLLLIRQDPVFTLRKLVEDSQFWEIVVQAQEDTELIESFERYRRIMNVLRLNFNGNSEVVMKLYDEFAQENRSEAYVRRDSEGKTDCCSVIDYSVEAKFLKSYAENILDRIVVEALPRILCSDYFLRIAVHTPLDFDYANFLKSAYASLVGQNYKLPNSNQDWLHEFVTSVDKFCSIGVFILDTLSPDFPVVFAKERYLQITSYPYKESINRNFRFLYGPESDKSTIERIQLSLQTGTDFSVAMVLYKKTGDDMRCLLSFKAIRDLDGKHILTVGLLRDASTVTVENQLLLISNMNEALSLLPSTIHTFKRTSRMPSLSKLGSDQMSLSVRSGRQSISWARSNASMDSKKISDSDGMKLKHCAWPTSLQADDKLLECGGGAREGAGGVKSLSQSRYAEMSAQEKSCALSQYINTIYTFTKVQWLLHPALTIENMIRDPIGRDLFSMHCSAGSVVYRHMLDYCLFLRELNSVQPSARYSTYRNLLRTNRAYQSAVSLTSFYPEARDGYTLETVEAFETLFLEMNMKASVFVQVLSEEMLPDFMDSRLSYGLVLRLRDRELHEVQGENESERKCGDSWTRNCHSDFADGATRVGGLRTVARGLNPASKHFYLDLVEAWCESVPVGVALVGGYSCDISSAVCTNALFSDLSCEGSNAFVSTLLKNVDKGGYEADHLSGDRGLQRVGIYCPDSISEQKSDRLLVCTHDIVRNSVDLRGKTSYSKDSTHCLYRLVLVVDLDVEANLLMQDMKNMELVLRYVPHDITGSDANEWSRTLPRSLLGDATLLPSLCVPMQPVGAVSRSLTSALVEENSEAREGPMEEMRQTASGADCSESGSKSSSNLSSSVHAFAKLKWLKNPIEYCSAVLLHAPSCALFTIFADAFSSGLSRDMIQFCGWAMTQSEERRSCDTPDDFEIRRVTVEFAQMNNPFIKACAATMSPLVDLRYYIITIDGGLMSRLLQGFVGFLSHSVFPYFVKHAWSSELVETFFGWDMGEASSNDESGVKKVVVGTNWVEIFKNFICNEVECPVVVKSSNGEMFLIDGHDALFDRPFKGHQPAGLSVGSGSYDLWRDAVIKEIADFGTRFGPEVYQHLFGVSSLDRYCTLVSRRGNLGDAMLLQCVHPLYGFKKPDLSCTSQRNLEECLHHVIFSAVIKSVSTSSSLKDIVDSVKHVKSTMKDLAFFDRYTPWTTNGQPARIMMEVTTQLRQVVKRCGIPSSALFMSPPTRLARKSFLVHSRSYDRSINQGTRSDLSGSESARENMTKDAYKENVWGKRASSHCNFDNLGLGAQFSDGRELSKLPSLSLTFLQDAKGQIMREGPYCTQGRKSCVSLNDIEVESGSYVNPSKCRPVNQPFSCLSISSCTDLDQQSSLLSERSPLGSPSWSETISVYGQSTSTSIPPVSPPQHSKWEHDRSPLFRGRYVSNGSLDRLLGDCSEARAEVSSARPEGMSQQLNSRSVMLSGKSDSNTDAQRAHSGCSEGNLNQFSPRRPDVAAPSLPRPLSSRSRGPRG